MSAWNPSLECGGPLSLLTLFPTTKVSPLGAHANVLASPRSLISLVQVFDLASQNRATPSLLRLHSSASLVGLKATFSIGPEWPLSSVEKRTFGFSGFPVQTIVHELRL